MLTQSERAALAARLRRGQASRTRSRDVAAGLTELPLSYGQEQLWFLDRFAPGLPTYNSRTPCAWPARSTGRAGPGAGRAGGPARGAAHPAGGRPGRPPGPGHRPARPVAWSWSTWPAWRRRSGRPAARADRGRGRAAVRPGRRPAVADRLRLLRACDARPSTCCSIVVHHTRLRWLVGRRARARLAALYRREVAGEPAPAWPSCRCSSPTTRCWERDRLQGPALAELVDYWRGTLDGFETLQLPTDRPRPVLDELRRRRSSAMPGRELLDGLRELSRREGTTLFVTLLAALQALLHRYTGQDDLVVGTASANRGRAELEPLIGFLVNTLPIRADLSGDPTLPRAAGAGSARPPSAPTPTRTCRSPSWCEALRRRARPQPRRRSSRSR